MSGKMQSDFMEMKPCLDDGCRQAAFKRMNEIKTKG